MMNDTPLKYMLLGDACTQVTDPVAKASRYWKVAQLSYAVMHPMFSKKNYPNLFRIVPSENEFNAPRMALLRKYNWERSTRTSPATLLLTTTWKKTSGSSLETSMKLGRGGSSTRRTGKTCMGRSTSGIVAAYIPTWWRKQDDVNCTVEEVETALKGALLMDLLPLSSSSDITISGLSFPRYAYDGIWAIALALHNMSKFYPDPALRHRKDLLRNFKYRDDNWQAAFLNALNATSFTGHRKYSNSFITQA
ncbi:Gamma-aminobutyric acid type B receptor subunit 2 [Orchesella cincta]|uniref:Gamma-aminobutyric acid type B receptor subunit 2 n=1 Tax=Orchesella cincta TaxID=48709 RepID=A0A1D2M152_ORCCI|nr:Gamma-aminobutyric acid type B receptor subunit 2 [Orchesella cincta]